MKQTVAMTTSVAPPAVLSATNSSNGVSGSPAPAEELLLRHQRKVELVFQQVEMQSVPDTLMSALVSVDTIDYEELETEINNVFETIEKKNPVMILMEYAQCTRGTVNLVEVGAPSGPPHMPRFTMAAVVNGRPFTRVRAGCKKHCRFGAAYLAWKTLIRDEQDRIEDMLENRCDTFHDRLATMAHLEYMRQVERNPCSYCGRKVLAAVIMFAGSDDGGQVVSLGTGNRTIGSTNLTLDGTCVNDSHAEVTARRAFIRFIYAQLNLYASGSSRSIFTSGGACGKLRLKPGVSFSMYISSSPCGDATLFTRLDHINNKDNSATREPLFTSKCQSLLRTKIDAGQGTIPVEPGYTQSWISLQFGKRLQTMSCTDKVTKWNIVGLQGALLSHFIEPIYLKHISISENFVYGHVSRAFYYRLSKSSAEPQFTMPPGYKPCMPDLGEGKFTYQVDETEKSKCYSINWNRLGDRAEVVDGTNGKVVYCNEEQPSRIAKVSFYNEFKKICTMLKRQDILELATYYDAKQAAEDYQSAKQALNKKFFEQGYGQWVTKPIEVDYFS